MRRRVLRALGVLHILAGLALNPWLLGRLLSPDGSIDSLFFKTAVLALEAALLALGAFTLARPGSERAANLNLLALSSVVAAPLLGESAWRAAIASGSKKLRDPALYAEYSSDDDYWKLEQRWGPRWKAASPERVHPLLGWSQDRVTAENPLGLSKASLRRLRSAKPKLLFYGDSFVRGAADPGFRLPEYLDARVGRMTVVDLGVGGFGLDQTYLMFRETHPKTRGPVVLVGVFLDDLDRSALTVRSSQKPYFVADPAGRLTLAGIPVEKDQPSFFASHPASIRSFLWAFVRRTVLKRTDPGKAELKRRVNGGLLDLFQAEAGRTRTRVLFALFYGEADLRATPWQEEFLKRELELRGLPYVDTKPLLLGHARASGAGLPSFYSSGDGHHNNLGNRVIAEGILARLRELGFVR